MKRKNSSLQEEDRNVKKPHLSFLMEVSAIQPLLLKINYITGLEDALIKNSEHLLPVLIIGEVITKSCYGLELFEVLDRLEFLYEIYKGLDTDQRLCGKLKDEDEEKEKDDRGLKSEILLKENDMLMKELGEKLSLYDEDDSNEGYSIEVVEALQTRGIHIEILIQKLTILNSYWENSCTKLGKGMMTLSELVKKGEVFLKKKNPTIAEALQVIEALREKPMLKSVGEDEDTYSKFFKTWNKWILAHPAVYKYLDPQLIILENVVGGPPAGFAAFTATLPNLPGGALNNVTDVGGANWNNVYSHPNVNSAMAVAVALRTHYASPPGGVDGGAGAALRIMRCTSSPGSTVQY